MAQHAEEQAADRADAAYLLHIVCWFAALAIPTVLLKFFYFDHLYVGGFPAALDSFGVEPGTIGRALLALSFFSGDLLECAVLVGTTFAIGHRWLNLRLPLLISGTTSIVVLLAAANWLSFDQLGTFVTLDALAVSYRWLSENPEIIDSYLRKRNLAVVLVGISWSFVPLVAVRLASRLAVPPRLLRALFGTLVAIVAVAGLTHLAVLGVVFGETPFPFRGYWSSTVRALVQPERTTLLAGSAPVEQELRGDYERLVYPLGPVVQGAPVVEVPAERRKPRHIVILSLETAPYAYYPIVANPEFPTLARMSEQAIVLDRHYANTPFTSRANYAMLTGTYPTHSAEPIKYGAIATDGLATVLARHDYRTVYVDSSKIDWRPGKKHRKVIESLGFEQLFERENAADTKGPRTYEQKLVAERRSLQVALDAIVSAERDGTKAFVFIDTIIGHYPWPGPPENEELPGPQKLLDLCRTFDSMLAEFLSSLDAAGLSEEILLLVTGDHGLRYENESASLGEQLGDPEVGYHVPFLLYAPGLIEQPTFVTQNTSHVDITPTLLDLVGIRVDKLLHHGSSVLESRFADRVVFLMSNTLSPNDRFLWRDYFFTSNSLTGEAYVTGGADGSRLWPLEKTLAEFDEIPEALQDPGRVVRVANDLFDDTAAVFLYRAGFR